MKKLSLSIVLYCLLFVSSITKAIAQRDIIYKNDTTQIRCKILKATMDKYDYAFVDSALKVYRTSILKNMVDSVRLNYYDSNLVQHKLFTKKQKLQQVAIQEVTEQPKNWKFSFGIGLNFGNLIEFNNPSGSDKKTLSATVTLDLGLNYVKDGARFAMTNELHTIFSLQKTGLTRTDYIQRVSNDLNTLHDFSIGIGRNKKWNFNLIAKAGTMLATVYGGDYYKNYTLSGAIEGFLSPYSITVSPGIKLQPNNDLRVSISPYSFNLYGIKNNAVTSKGIYITEMDASGNYKNFLYKRLGAEINFWYDKQIKNWLSLQYRIGLSSNYFEKIAKNGLLDGLFITKIKLLKNIYLTHRATLNGDFSVSPFKPFYSQTALLSYTKSF